MKRAPFIGITGYHVSAEEGFGGSLRGLPGQGFSVVSHDYIHAVERAGGIPISIPVMDGRKAREMMLLLDGLILSGGEDIDPALYGDHPDMRCWSLSPERDHFEWELLKAALDLKKPVLAICRGMQLVNVYFGGSLYKDVADYPGHALAHQFNKAPRWYLAHKVKLTHSLLRSVHEVGEMMTNSYHHQVIKEVGKDLAVAAIAEDGVVEGLVHPDYPHLLAIQWHPETLAVKYESGMTLFRWLVEQIRKEAGEKV